MSSFLKIASRFCASSFQESAQYHTPVTHCSCTGRQQSFYSLCYIASDRTQCNKVRLTTDCLLNTERYPLNAFSLFALFSFPFHLPPRTSSKLRKTSNLLIRNTISLNYTYCHATIHTCHGLPSQKKSTTLCLKQKRATSICVVRLRMCVPSFPRPPQSAPKLSWRRLRKRVHTTSAFLTVSDADLSAPNMYAHEYPSASPRDRNVSPQAELIEEICEANGLSGTQSVPSESAYRIARTAPYAYLELSRRQALPCAFHLSLTQQH